MTNKEIADALLLSDWSGVSIGQKAIIMAAVRALSEKPVVVFNRGTLKEDGQFWMPVSRFGETLKEQGFEVLF